MLLIVVENERLKFGILVIGWSCNNLNNWEKISQLVEGWIYIVYLASGLSVKLSKNLIVLI